MKNALFLIFLICLLSGCGKRGNQLYQYPSITSQEAVSIVKEYIIPYTEDEDSLEIIATELVSDDQRDYYRVEVSADGRKQIMEVDALTKVVTNADTIIPPTESAPSQASPAPQGTTPTVEATSGQEPSTADTPALPKDILSPDAAMALALERVPGATVADIVEFQQDADDEKIEYEGEIHYNGLEYEFEIDAYSGAFREWDVEE